ncbi:MAG: HPr family phosphocarrier protein [Lachnospiraceae bacterium]|jgi:phosphocarrier protein|nr:HPr family phosphocarrier protein [Lachnospiraceae bacterium]
MINKTVTVKNPTGLHARPAAAFVKEASRHKCSVLIKKDGRSFNGKSIISVLSACITCGTKIELETDGEGESQALDDIVAAVESGLGE